MRLSARGLPPTAGGRAAVLDPLHPRAYGHYGYYGRLLLQAVELLLSIPFILGFETAAVARVLAFSLVLEVGPAPPARPAASVIGCC